MSRISGKRGRIYIGIASGAAASPLPFQASWSLDASTDRMEVTAFEDVNRTYISGLPDAKGDFSGFYDDSTAQTYTAAVDGTARNFYLYPSLLTATQYWFGQVFVDFSIDGKVDGPVNMKATWNAASTISKVG